MAVRALCVVRPFIKNGAFPFGIAAILGSALISSTYSEGENQFIKWKIEFLTLFNVHRSDFLFDVKLKKKISKNVKGEKTWCYM